MTDHWAGFLEFARWDRYAGGPDSHMATVGRMCDEEPRAGRVWWGGCYVGVYNVPTSEALYRELPDNAAEWEGWLTENWAGIATRRERRAVRRPEQLARYLREYRDWSLGYSERLARSATMRPAEGFEMWWESCQTVYGLGRYAALKLLEFLRRYAGLNVTMPDLRLAGGWSPRAGLALLWPQAAELLLSDGHVAEAERWGNIAQSRAAEEGLQLSRFEMQVLLCDYKQAWQGRQYPGRSLDSELHYAAAVEPHWGRSGMFEARADLFPPECLGEVSGWSDVRKELGRCWRDHGYMWSDARFVYPAADLAAPVARA